MNIDSVRNGVVIDHITAGNGARLYELLGLDSLDCSIALIKNVNSRKMGKKEKSFRLYLRGIGNCSPLGRENAGNAFLWRR